MAPLTVFDHLSLHPFLADVPATWLHRLAMHGRPALRHAGVRLFHEGAPAGSFWLLRSGAVALDFHVPGRGDIVIERIGAEGVVGWSWLLPPYRWSLGAVVAAECQAVQLDAAGVRRLLAEDAELGRELTTRFLAVMAERLHATRVRLAELYAYPETTPRSPSPVPQDQ
ncbi:cyclic nucleotide-binding domain-containing protein [Jidongwangia harbinensis]|uniref:cyclic nucleotide-binding domain-containing protein n=1 Tax=Jidongwangia harbinensis TaxID=2878561 RepID=UPI001CDA496E|nr:cyclic nucleotide-binding domain-containing protein [Jidongwangia harbinensis]MCA2218998.1 cyclic nucleotide-binding domain-containing protein [Jidongwangia harbinensis]